MDARPFLQGRWQIDIVADGEREFVREFLEAAAQENPVDYKKILARLDFATEYGPPRNQQQYRAIKGVPGQLAEFKGGSARIMCFFDGAQRIVLTHGFFKQRQRTDREEIDRALRIRDAYKLQQARERGRQ